MNRVLLLAIVFVSSLEFDPLALHGLECHACKDTVAAFRDLAHLKPGQDIAIDIAIGICVAQVKETYEVCKGAVTEMGYIVVDSLIDHYLDPEWLCYEVNACASPKFVQENFEEWQQKLLATKQSVPYPTPTYDSSYFFGHMTDIHMDFYYSEGSNTQCGMPVCCREWNGKGSSGYWGDYLCDIPYRTLEAGVQQLAALNPDFVIWTGDVPGHDVWNQSQSYQLEYQRVSAQLMQQYFPETPVYSIFGNHGCFPVNVCDPNDSGWLLEPYAEWWGYWLPESAKATIRTMGTYSTLHKDTNLRIIAINTQVCNSLNFYLFKNATDPNGQIGWVINELEKAEEQGEKVYIIGHIPFTSDNCLSVWTAHLNTIITRFSNTILGQFFGHNHKDHFAVNRAVDTHLPNNLQWIAPSMTTYKEKNPSFRLYEGDSDSKLVVDIHQYRMDLPTANKENKPVFEKAYSMKTEYSLPDLSPATMELFARQMKEDETVAVKWYFNYESGGPSVKSECSEKCREGIYCDAAFGTAEEISECRNSTQKWSKKVIKAMYGPWLYKVDN